ncbi:MAG: metallophosphoesterase family protein [Peptostreptococcaceae bacterium]
MRFIHTSDWHLGKKLNGYSRIEEQKKFCDDFVERVRDLNIDLVIIAGDVIDCNDSSLEGNHLFYQTVSRISNDGQRCVLVVRGDNDSTKQLSVIRELSKDKGVIVVGSLMDRIEPKKYSGYEILDSKEGYIKLNIRGNEIGIITLPYCNENELNNFISSHNRVFENYDSYTSKVGQVFNILEESFCDKDINIAIGHVIVDGGEDYNLSTRLLDSTKIVKKDLPNKAQYVALGHFHKMQKISERINAYYSGSPLPYSKYEREDSKGGYLVEINNNKTIVEELYFDNYKPIELFICNEISRALEICEENKHRDIWSYFEIKTSKSISSQNIKKMKETLKDIVEIMPLNNRDDSSQECNIDKSMAELFKSYYYYNNESEVSGELMNLFLEISSKEGETNYEAN